MSTDKIFSIIKSKYNSNVKQNSSINAVYRCLFSFQNLTSKIIKHQNEISDKNKHRPISYSFLLAYKNQNNNWDQQLLIIRDALTFDNTCFIDPGEIEPEDLIEFIIKKLHIENNKKKNTLSRLYPLDNDPDIFNRQNILSKFFTTFREIFQSFIGDHFFFVSERIIICSICNLNRYYFESYFYLTLDIDQAIKSGINLNNPKFIIECLRKQHSSHVNKILNCPKCHSQQIHSETKKLFSLPYYLIINIRQKTSNQNIIYPMMIDFSSLIMQDPNSKYNLTGVIKKSINNGKKSFRCIYKDCQNPQQWILSEGNNFTPIAPNFYDNVGYTVMLFYQKEK